MLPEECHEPAPPRAPHAAHCRSAGGRCRARTVRGEGRRVLYAAFAEAGLPCTLVGGSAIEVHAPGAYKSSDIDLVVDPVQRTQLLDRIAAVFTDLGFGKMHRHLVLDGLFVEVPSFDMVDPHEIVTAGGTKFDVVTKEALVFRRTVGFMHWQTTAFGQQVIDMLVAFGETLEMDWLGPALEREGSLAAFGGLKALASSGAPVTEEVLRDLLDDLHHRPRTPRIDIDAEDREVGSSDESPAAGAEPPGSAPRLPRFP